jgi:SAM-dependent methyltransferase
VVRTHARAPAAEVRRGYGVTDAPYTRSFVAKLAPAWLDHVAVLSGCAPPARERGFAWCELGCGQGVTPAILAATHPRGRFVGIDAMPAHIRYARGLAARAAIKNVGFFAADFADVPALRRQRFDYIVAHGVYSWIDPQGQAALRQFIDRHLRPGGLVYVSYNAMPGWAADLPLQRLLMEFGQAAVGGSLARIDAAVGVARAMAKANAPALAGNRAMARVLSSDRRYLAHEFLGKAWQPLYVTQVRAAMAEIRLVPLGSATLIENFDSMMLGKSTRKLLDAIADGDRRELARDFFIDRHLRCDVFTRGGTPLDDRERSRRLLESTFTLARPPAAIDFATTTPAGRLSFDNPVSRRLVAEFAQGPRRLADLRGASIAGRDLVANALALCAAEHLIPVEPGRAAIDRLTQAVYRRLDGAGEVLCLPLPCGTALPVDRGLLRRLRDGRGLREYPGWQEFLAAQGAGVSMANGRRPGRNKEKRH